jgi:hypothetical protein
MLFFCEEAPLGKYDVFLEQISVNNRVLSESESESFIRVTIGNEWLDKETPSTIM